MAHFGFVVTRIAPTLVRMLAEGGRLLVETVDDPIQRVTVAVVEVDGAVPIELVAPLPGVDSPVSSRLRRGGGLDHICYIVDDVAAALAEEEESGGVIVCEPVVAVAFDRTIGFIHRRSGLVVEYMSAEAPRS